MMKRFIKVMALAVMLLALCACGEEKGSKSYYAVKHDGKAISTATTKAQVESLWGSPERTETVGKTTTYYYFGDNYVRYNSENKVFLVRVANENLEIAGVKVGDSLSTLRENFPKLEAYGSNPGEKYAACILNSDNIPTKQLVVQKEDDEYFLIIFNMDGDKVKEIAIAKMM